MKKVEKTDGYVLPPKSVVEKKGSWSGKLTKESINLTGKKERLLILTTDDGKKVVLSRKAVVNFSLIGMDMNLNVGKDLSLDGMASQRKTAAGTVYLVSKISTATRKDSAIYSDLLE